VHKGLWLLPIAVLASLSMTLTARGNAITQPPATAIEVATTTVLVPEQQRGCVGIPRWLDLAGEIDIEDMFRTAQRVEDERHPPALALVPDQHALVARDRAPFQRRPAIDLNRSLGR